MVGMSADDKMLRCGCVEQGLEYITFYVQEYIAHLAACSGHPLVRNGPLGVPTFVILTRIEIYGNQWKYKETNHTWMIAWLIDRLTD